MKNHSIIILLLIFLPGCRIPQAGPGMNSPVTDQPQAAFVAPIATEVIVPNATGTMEPVNFTLTPGVCRNGDWNRPAAVYPGSDQPRTMGPYAITIDQNMFTLKREID